MHVGEIMLLGRKDFQIKHLGYRIELGEIEHAAVQLDGIRNCCVVYNQEKKEITMFYESDSALPVAQMREKLCTAPAQSTCCRLFLTGWNSCHEIRTVR